MKIGLLSDTHGFLDPKVLDYFSVCDEIWHAGDIGSMAVVSEIENFKPLKAVFGNVDDQEMQIRFPEDLCFECGGFNIWMTHIGGAPPNYNPRINKLFMEKTPDIFICGHSHILRVIRDPKKNNLLYLNPGAAGNHGFHLVKTIVRFELSDRKVINIEAIELGKRGAIPHSGQR